MRRGGNHQTLGRLRLSVADARDLAEGALRGIGYRNDEARIIADHVIDAAMCGYEYSGLAKILNVPESEHFRLPRRSMKVLRETEVSLAFDGGNNVGMLALFHAAQATIKKTAVYGIALVSERAFRSRERALREGLEIDRVVFDALVALRAQ
jgi:LDH2 family malate/lactate/ureidoglycolate dehydrogenase